MVQQAFTLYRFTFLNPGSGYQTVYLMADDWEAAFRLMYITYGDDINIASCERLATEGIDLLVDEVSYLQAHRSYDSVVIDGISKFQ